MVVGNILITASIKIITVTLREARVRGALFIHISLDIVPHTYASLVSHVM